MPKWHKYVVHVCHHNYFEFDITLFILRKVIIIFQLLLRVNHYKMFLLFVCLVENPTGKTANGNMAERSSSVCLVAAMFFYAICWWSWWEHLTNITCTWVNNLSKLRWEEIKQLINICNIFSFRSFRFLSFHLKDKSTISFQFEEKWNINYNLVFYALLCM